MGTLRTAAAVVSLAVETGIAVLGVVVHYGFTADYGDITDSTLGSLWHGFTVGIGLMALVFVGLPALVVVAVSTHPRLRLSAATVPLLMVVGMLAVTPAALRARLEADYSATPRCVSEEATGEGATGESPGARAARESQRTFDSIDHVGWFGGGGGSGVGGCDRPFTLTEDVDVVRHYRAALHRAGWRLVADDAHHLRAERHGMAFEVVACTNGGFVWAGPAAVHDATPPCDQQ